MTCSVCDEPVGVTDRFCMRCGAPVEGQPASEDGDAPDADAAEDDATDLSIPVPDEHSATSVDLVACPSCGASNAARRRRCGRCEARLHVRGDDTPTPPREPVPRPPEVVSEPPHDRPEPTHARTTPVASDRMRRGVVVLVIGGGLLVGGGVGLAAGLGFGPFGTDDGPAFDPQAYSSDPAVLPQAIPVASATRADEDGRSFVPANTADEDPATSWQAPVADPPLRLQTRFLAPTWIHRIEVVNGDQAGDAAFADVARVRHARITLGEDVVLDATLLDQAGTQVIELPEPALTDEVTWEIDAWHGEPPVALAEVRYVGWTADEADQAEFTAD